MRILAKTTLPWRRVLTLAGLAAFLDLVAILAFVMVVGIGARALFGEAGDVMVTESGYHVGLVGGAAAFAALAFGAGYLAVWLPGRPATPAHGIVIGLVASLFVALEHALVIPPFVLQEALVYSILGASFGWLGARFGSDAVVGQEAVSRATSEINEAEDPDAIAAVIRRLLCRPDVSSVAVWTPEAKYSFGADGHGSLGSYTPEGIWSRGGDTNPYRVDAALDPGELPVPGGLSRHRSGVTLSCEQLVGAGDALLWGGARFALLVPLSTLETGFLVVALASSRSPFKRGVAGGITAITSTVATKLDNIRLLAKEREHAQLQRDNAVLGERRRMAADLHDTLTQGLAGILRNAEAVHLPEDTDPDSARHLEMIKREASENLKEARRLVWQRGPSALEHKTLAEALAELARGWSERTGIAADHHLEGEPVRLPDTAVAALYRVAQEALNNVHKHANASAARVTLSYLDDLVVLDVCDDGVGFASEPAPDDGGGEGFGLGGMRWRLGELGGSLFVESEPGVGTSVTAELAPSAVPVNETADGRPRHVGGAASPDAFAERGA